MHQIIDNKTGKGLVVQAFDHFVKHLSTIRIHCNAITPFVYVDPLNPYLQPTLGFTSQTHTPSLPSNPVPKVVNQKKGDDFVPHEYYCLICPQSMDKRIDPRLDKHRLNLNFDSYKRFSDLMFTIRDMSAFNCDDITDYDWINVIPYKMRAFGHKDFSPKLWKNSFEIFLNKYIEVFH